MSIDETSVEEITPATEAPSSVSRRTLMKTAAGAGVAAATIGVVGVANASGTPRQPSASSLAGGAPLAGPADARTAPAAAPLVVHVTDLAKGTLDVFTNGKRSQIHDTDLAHRIVHAAQQ